MGSDDSHFNVSLIVRDKIARKYPQTTTFLKRKSGEAASSRGPSMHAYQLDQTGSQLSPFAGRGLYDTSR